MRTLRVIEVSSESPEFARRHNLRLPKRGEEFSLAHHRGHGRFGDVFAVDRADPKGSEPAIAVKVIKEPPSPAPSVSSLHKALAGLSDPSWTEQLLALPFTVGRADVEGEELEVTFMLDLAARGYEGTSEEKVFSEEHQLRPTHERVELAYAYARKAALLEAARYLHGDQNLPNLLVNPSSFDVQIVDLDVGAVLVSGHERAQVAGKEGDKNLPPEVVVVSGEGGIDQSRWDLGAERWPVGYITGSLLFGAEPGFFISPSAIDAYAEEGPWPEIDRNSTTFEKKNAAAYEYWRRQFEDAPGDIRETFGRFFRAGTRGADRPTAQDWVEALNAARQKPKFKYIRVEPVVAPEGTEVVLSWQAEGAEYVEHPSLGELPAQGEERIAVSRTARQKLTAVNFYGRVEKESEVVRVVPLPRLTTIPLAGFPDLQLKARIATGAPARFVAPQPPRFTRALGAPPATPAPVRGPRPLPAPPHFGSLFRPIPVARQIRQMMRKEPSR